MVQVMCLKNFFDIENNIKRNVGDKWLVSKTRANEILNSETKGLIDIISVEPEPKALPPQSTIKPKRTRKAK
jgi:hypothetical protein